MQLLTSLRSDPPNPRTSIARLISFLALLPCRGFLLLGFGVIAILPFTSCSSSNSAPALGTNDSTRLNWESYPPMPLMRLAALPCQLLPKSSITIHSPLVGVLRVYATQPQSHLTNGFVWAEFEPAMFAAEADALEEARLKLEERERLQLELELPKQKLKMEREFEEAQRQLAFLNLLSTNQDLAHLNLPMRPQSGNPIRPEALGKARLEVDLLQQSLGYLQATNLSILGIDLPGQRSEWQRRKLEFDRRHSQARIKMPFNGQLTISLPLTDGVEEYPVNAGQELAVARDLTQIRLRVSLANPAWVGLPPNQLFALVRLPHGETLRADYAFQKIERIQAREESVYYFQFPPEKSESAARLMGVDVTCELWLKLPQAAHIVPKLSLVLNHASAFQGRDWMHGVSYGWPGAQVIAEGQTELAIVRPTLARK